MPTGPREARPDDRLHVEPGISSFRIWSFGPSRNDGELVAAIKITHIARTMLRRREGRMRAMRAFGLAAGVAAIMVSGAPRAQAQSNYPDRPIHIIVPYPPGGIVDIIARAVTEQVGRDWKQPVVVEARPGANSNIGTAAVARSDPDGYTWLVTGPAVLVNPTLYKDAGWDTMQSFKCVGLAVWNQSVAVVNPSMPAKTLAEFVALARSKPGQLNFGNPGTGSSID